MLQPTVDIDIHVYSEHIAFPFHTKCCSGFIWEFRVWASRIWLRNPRHYAQGLPAIVLSLLSLGRSSARFLTANKKAIVFNKCLNAVKGCNLSLYDGYIVNYRNLI